MLGQEKHQLQHQQVQAPSAAGGGGNAIYASNTVTDSMPQRLAEPELPSQPNQSSRFPLVTLALLAVNIGIYAYPNMVPLTKDVCLHPPSIVKGLIRWVPSPTHMRDILSRTEKDAT
jgi:hypothetical protein